MNTSVKILVIIFAVGSLCGKGFAQKAELGASFNVGGFRFIGASTEGSTAINLTSGDEGYTNNPFGSKYGVSESITVHLRRITKIGFVLGVEAGFLHQQSRSDVKQVWTSGPPSVSLPAKGHANFKTNGITALPQIGFRTKVSGLDVTFLVGIENYFIVDAKDRARAKADGETYKVTNDRTTIDSDLRSNFQLGVSKGPFGIHTSYSVGVSNYQEGYAGGPSEAFGRLLLIGFDYQFSKK